MPNSFWQGFFLADDPTLAKIWGPLIGPARRDHQLRLLDRQRAACGRAVERRHQLRRRVAFIFADLIILPILNIYRKYYGCRMAGFLLATFYAAMAPPASPSNSSSRRAGLIPTERNAKIVEASITWNYTTVLNIIFSLLAALLVWRFIRTGGLPMLRAMNTPTSDHGHHHAEPAPS